MSTPLQRHLSGAAPARPGPLDVLREAQRMFQAGERVDMQTLAATLGVDRTTVYRWVGSRERLLVEVLWRLMSKTVARLREPTAAGARPTAAEVIVGATHAAMTNAGMRRFLQQEGDLALKLLTTKAGEFQHRLIELVADVVEADRRDGLLRSPLPAEELPYVLVRIMESYVYLGLITGEEPDTARAAQVIRVLLPS
ncbi:AcrR family transcriptional regulator [Thermocatellispora tengchongensis]|uniref:AcrR family transcriptional regulator n=1 Tax=Thermocatellispora tengchongensis TaxID=1073253 RepID=A0A840PDD2_9ACTN|nr:QsdR family transcriptional regulator [Thermocatellispora tengchongensis]MBB5136999.1 AcrR family transcriptional regulator [Thermocatellispora tengchongensis]